MTHPTIHLVIQGHQGPQCAKGPQGSKIPHGHQGCQGPVGVKEWLRR